MKVRNLVFGDNLVLTEGLAMEDSYLFTSDRVKVEPGILVKTVRNGLSVIGKGRWLVTDITLTKMDPVIFVDEYSRSTDNYALVLIETMSAVDMILPNSDLVTLQSGALSGGRGYDLIVLKPNQTVYVRRFGVNGAETCAIKWDGVEVGVVVSMGSRSVPMRGPGQLSLTQPLALGRALNQATEVVPTDGREGPSLALINADQLVQLEQRPSTFSDEPSRLAYVLDCLALSQSFKSDNDLTGALKSLKLAMKPLYAVPAGASGPLFDVRKKVAEALHLLNAASNAKRSS